jgi:hypothetical protein
MPLLHEPDITHAEWLTSTEDSWVAVCCFGPAGFARYGRLFHSLGPGDEGADRDVLVNLEGEMGADTLRVLVDVLARHTTTPDDCFFGLWDGFGDIHGSPSVGVVIADEADPSPRRSPWIPPAFGPEVMNAPRVEIPNRSYFLFRGDLAAAGQWGAADLLPGHPRTINSPNLMWPADHAWFTASEIDQPWTGVGGSQALLDDLLAHPFLDVEPTQRSDHSPYWRA